jgi:hypothetical protein
MKRKALWALLAAGITVVSTGLVRAQSEENAESEKNPQSEKNSLAGIWEETVTFRDGVTPDRRALIVYHKDGTLVATEGGNPMLEPPNIASEDIGLWKQTAPRTFEYINYVLFSDPKGNPGNPANKLRVRGRYTLESSNRYTGESFFEVLDKDGKVIFSGRVDNVGKRLTFSPFPPDQ